MTTLLLCSCVKGAETLRITTLLLCSTVKWAEPLQTECTFLGLKVNHYCRGKKMHGTARLAASPVGV